MLPSDMALLDHPETKKWVEVYAKDKVGPLIFCPSRLPLLTTARLLDLGSLLRRFCKGAPSHPTILHPSN